MTTERTSSPLNKVDTKLVDDRTGSAVCVGLSRFGPEPAHAEEPPADAWPALDYASEVTRELADALHDFGFDCTIHDEHDLPTAQRLGSLVGASLTAPRPRAVQVVHVLSHGHIDRSGVYVVGADGKWKQSTKVGSWVASIEEDPDHADLPHTLFVIDTCYAGQAARLDWLRAATAETKAWVIAATEPDKLAFNGRLTRALTTVLRRIHNGDLDFSPSTYVPFAHLVDHVSREVARLGGEPQYVTGTPADRPFAPPLIANPRPAAPDSHRAVLAKVDPLTGPFGDLDTALDPAHFLDRAAGHRNGDLTDTIGYFTGRHKQLAHLSASLDPMRHPCGLTVVTGRAGSGKSALLGAMVCALHPQLRGHTRQLWQDIPVPDTTWTGPLAAIHLRERNLADATTALTRQLHLCIPDGAGPPQVIQAVTHLTEPPLIIVDALDEAAGQDAILRQLLLPLTQATRGGGKPACTLWVGARPWNQFDDLLTATPGS